ncbi:MAG: hypothetical protein JXD23_12890 [Spirochaetales bacterium]|nr:hypothetical protein [Spirochaetales bacterium]
MGLLSKAISIQVMTGQSNGLLRRLTMISGELPPSSGAPVTAGAPVTGAAQSSAAKPSTRADRTAAAAVRRGGEPLPSGGGLLKKSLLFLNLEKEEAPSGESLLIVDFSENIERLRKKITGLAKDFSYFPALYSLLDRELHLPHSAFFLTHAARREFVPWMHRGLDPRLVSGLAFTARGWTEQYRNPGEPHVIEDGQRLFPALAGPLPRPLYMFPFTDRGTLEGSLMVSNFQLHADSRNSLFGLFRELSVSVGPTVAALTGMLKNLPRPERFFRTPSEALGAIMAREKGEGDSIHVVIVSLAPFLKTLADRYAFFDAVRLRETLLYAINCWFGRLGACVALGRDDIVLVARDNRCYGPRLLSRFVSDHLKALFRGLFDDAPPLSPTRAFECPADADLAPEAILSRLEA